MSSKDHGAQPGNPMALSLSVLIPSFSSTMVEEREDGEIKGESAFKLAVLESFR